MDFEYECLYEYHWNGTRVVVEYEYYNTVLLSGIKQALYKDVTMSVSIKLSQLSEFKVPWLKPSSPDQDTTGTSVGKSSDLCLYLWWGHTSK